MASKYSIVQYVPNPIADERINIGVVAFDGERVSVKFLKNWERVRHFGGENIDFLKDFAQRMKKAASSNLLFPGDKQDGTPQTERLAKIAQGWINSIQFTEPRGSLDDVDSLIEDITRSYLVELNHQKHKLRDRQAAAKIATSRIKKLLEKNEAKELLKINYRVSGSHTDHKFDAVVANGKPYFAAHGISFEVQIQENLQNSISWMITDVKESNPNFPLAIMTLPPKDKAPNYQQLKDIYLQTTSTYSELGAEVLTENEFELWVSKRLTSMSIL